MKLNRTSAFWDRITRNEINENWDMLEGLSVKLDGMYDDFENIVEDVAGGLNTNIENIINNGDFSKETTPTGWRTQNSSFSIKDNTLTLRNRTGSSTYLQYIKRLILRLLREKGYI